LDYTRRGADIVFVDPLVKDEAGFDILVHDHPTDARMLAVALKSLAQVSTEPN